MHFIIHLRFTCGVFLARVYRLRCCPRHRRTTMRSFLANRHLAKGFQSVNDQRRGGERGPVAPSVFKTVVPSYDGGWVRLPFTSATQVGHEKEF